MNKHEINIPSVAELAKQYDETINLPKWEGDRLYLKDSLSKEYAIRNALIEGGDAAADKVMGEIKPSDIANKDAGNWHQECPHIYYACWGNSGGLHPQGHARLYHYYVKKEPKCILAAGPGGQNMLHAWCYSSCDLSILQDLLERGVDPLQPDNDGVTPLDLVKEKVAKNPDQYDLYNQVMMSMMQEAVDKQVSAKKWVSAFPPKKNVETSAQPSL